MPSHSAAVPEEVLCRSDTIRLRCHVGSLSWEVQVCAGASAEIGFEGAVPPAERVSGSQVAATDLTSVVTLANEMRAALVENGLVNGAA